MLFACSSPERISIFFRAIIYQTEDRADFLSSLSTVPFTSVITSVITVPATYIRQIHFPYLGCTPAATR